MSDKRRAGSGDDRADDGRDDRRRVDDRSAEDRSADHSSADHSSAGHSSAGHSSADDGRRGERPRRPIAAREEPADELAEAPSDTSFFLSEDEHDGWGPIVKRRDLDRK